MEKLFLLELLVETVEIDYSKVRIDKNVLNAAKQLCIKFQFLSFPELVICEEDFCPTNGDYQKSVVNIKSGKSCLFSIRQWNAEDKSMPLSVTVIRHNPSPPHLTIGKSCINLGSSFTNILAAAHSPENTATVTKKCTDDYVITNSEGGDIGKIRMFIRLTCFGPLIVTQFQISGDENNSYLFRGNDESGIVTFNRNNSGNLFEKGGPSGSPQGDIESTQNIQPQAIIPSGGGQAMGPGSGQGVMTGTGPGMMTGGGQSMMQGGGQGTIPGGGQGMIPGSGQGMMTGGRQGMMPGGEQGMIPGGGQGMGSSSGQGMMPGGGQAMIPGSGQGMMTGDRQGMVPGGGQGMIPGRGQGMMPGGWQGMIPGGGQGIMPGGGMMYGYGQGMVPGSGLGMMPGGGQGMIQGGTAGGPPMMPSTAEQGMMFGTSGPGMMYKNTGGQEMMCRNMSGQGITSGVIGDKNKMDYKEFGAEVNGHSLSIKVLRKPKKQKKPKETFIPICGHVPIGKESSSSSGMEDTQPIEQLGIHLCSCDFPLPPGFPTGSPNTSKKKKKKKENKFNCPLKLSGDYCITPDCPKGYPSFPAVQSEKKSPSMPKTLNFKNETMTKKDGMKLPENKQIGNLGDIPDTHKNINKHSDAQENLHTSGKPTFILNMPPVFPVKESSIKTPFQPNQKSIKPKQFQESSTQYYEVDVGTTIITEGTTKKVPRKVQPKKGKGKKKKKGK